MTRPMFQIREARTGKYLVFFALAITLILVGALKFLDPAGIEPLVSNSPILSWVYDIWSVPTFGYLLGGVEVLAGIVIALRPAIPRLAVFGASFAIVLFLVTISFLFSTPEVLAPAGFPLLTAMPGQFLAKDLLFLAAAIFVLQDSLIASRKQPRPVRVEPAAPRERVAP